MIKSEILELKKQLKPERFPFDRIATCYVNGEKNKIFSFADTFAAHDEEEVFKYLKIFNAALSGKEGKAIHNIPFPLEAESAGGAQELLLKLRDSKLNDEDLLNEFYDKVIANFEFGENFIIILAYGTYDVPTKAKDGAVLEDSETTYAHINCAICPVKLEKASLSISADGKAVESSNRRLIIDAPIVGFLFPAFNDRAEDIHNMLYFTKKADNMYPELLLALSEYQAAMPATEQLACFNKLIDELTHEKVTYEQVSDVYENVLHKIEEHQQTSPEPLEFSKEDIKDILNSGGIDTSTFDKVCEEIEFPDTMMAQNTIDTSKVKVTATDVVVNVKPERTDMLSKKMVDGRMCLVISLDGNVTVNDIITSS